jgi:hypothetical protein
MGATPGPQHRLIVEIVNRYPEVAEELARLDREEFPSHDRVQAAPNTQEVKSGSPMATDTTLHCLSHQATVNFAHVEMQDSFSWGKFADLRARCGID